MAKEEEEGEEPTAATQQLRRPRLGSPTQTSRPWCSRTFSLRASTGPLRRSGGEGKMEREEEEDHRFRRQRQKRRVEKVVDLFSLLLLRSGPRSLAPL